MKELTIKGQVYQFNFGMGFLKDIDKTVQIKSENGKVEDAGLRYAIGGLIDGNPKSICTILYYGNKGQNPRLTEALIEEFIDDPDTDIDDLFEEVMGFLKSSNATKCITEKTQKAVEDMMK